MYLETTEELAETLADWCGIYGTCKSDGEPGCRYKEVCRDGFIEAIQQRITEAVKNDLIEGQADIETMNEVATDCRTDEGITVGLIDSIIFIARALSKRDLQSATVQTVLRDFRNDEDVKKLCSAKFSQQEN